MKPPAVKTCVWTKTCRWSAAAAAAVTAGAEICTKFLRCWTTLFTYELAGER